MASGAGRPRKPAAAAAITAAPSGPVVSPPSRRRRHRPSNKEPLRSDFQTQAEFQAAWEHWRMQRDRNNSAVKRSRERAQDKGEDFSERFDRERAEMETQLAGMERDIRFYRRVLANPLSLTPRDMCRVASIVANTSAAAAPAGGKASASANTDTSTSASISATGRARVRANPVADGDWTCPPPISVNGRRCSSNADPKVIGEDMGSRGLRYGHCQTGGNEAVAPSMAARTTPQVVLPQVSAHQQRLRRQHSVSPSQQPQAQATPSLGVALMPWTGSVGVTGPIPPATEGDTAFLQQLGHEPDTAFLAQLVTDNADLV